MNKLGLTMKISPLNLNLKFPIGLFNKFQNGSTRALKT